jgi:hypothetical protein
MAWGYLGPRSGGTDRGLLVSAPAPALAALLFLAGLGVMARASVAGEEAFLGWLLLLA